MQEGRNRAETGGSGMEKRMSWSVYCAAAQRRMRRTVCRAALRRRMWRAACCALVLALVLPLCGDMVLPPPQELLLPELGAVERQLRALTAGAPDGWRYSLRVSPGPGGVTLAADAARRDACGAWETIHTLWQPENGAWRMVRQTRQKHASLPGAQGEHE